MYCVLCSRCVGISRLSCEPCQERINEQLRSRWLYLAASEPITLLSLSRYGEDVRRLIHSAKIRGDFRARAFLEALLQSNSRDMQRLLVGVTTVIAAPSSLWGRLRGRPDLAAAIAVEVAKQHGLALGYAPFRRFWRWQKRAQLGGAFRQKPGGSWSAYKAEADDISPAILLVDDVVTTGTTLSELAIDFPGYQLRALVLADAIGVLT